jgi:sigma-54 specific flagellar transcriptional regulator A
MASVVSVHRFGNVGPVSREVVDEDVSALIIGGSSVIVALRNMVRRVARSDASILITGPSGAGKEMVARAIHAASDRSDKPFVALNCGAIPAELVESELFGHEKGSFTGAHARRIGRFEEADGGTLFLDEIGDMRFDMQVKLLRVLEDGLVTRVGGTAILPVDVRIVCATHQDLDRAMADKRFREDLYFRLGVVVVNIPDLASRVEDIPALIDHFQRRKRMTQRVRFDASGMARLMTHRWPGNVRELRNVIERAAVLFPGELIDARDVDGLLHRGGLQLSHGGPVSFSPQADMPTPIPALPPLPPIPLPVVPIRPAAPRKDGPPIPINLKELLETMELERIQMALDMADGVISEAARLLMLKRTTLIEKMRKYGVDRQL